jgi:SulP family sulfate permease
MFIDNGGDSRTAGILLAGATTAVWIAGPAMIGYIPICLVGSLIFLLGIDLMKEALWDTWGKCHKLEYLTILAIVLIMGVHDFVVGILIGIILACVSYVVQSSRHPALRASYTGVVAESTVRRPRADVRYLNKVRGQIRVLKLGGFLFFGTIVSVEDYMRSLIEQDQFEKQPVSFIIVDFTHVTDVDFSSSEGFQRINRILTRKNVQMILSGVSFAHPVGQALQNVGLLDEEEGNDECPPPQVFEDLNTALESCENELLEVFHKHCNSASKRQQTTPPMSINGFSTPPSQIATGGSPTSFGASSLNPAFSSPRRGARLVAARSTMREANPLHDTLSIPSQDGNTATVPSHTPSRYRAFPQPLKIILQTFEDISPLTEDFWHPIAPAFTRHEYPKGTLLYRPGDVADAFYIVESGRLRSIQEGPAGRFSEVILPGTTCGELPFFSESERTGKVVVEEDSVVWGLGRREWEGLGEGERGELLRVGLKLTMERMGAVTGYVLVTAS